MTALILAACVLAGVFIRWAVRYDSWERDLAALDDEELAAALKAYPDLLDHKRK